MYRKVTGGKKKHEITEKKLTRFLKKYIEYEYMLMS